MRVLLATNTYPTHLNGQAVFAGSLAEGLVSLGHEVTVLVPGVDRDEVEVRNGVKVIATPAIDLRFIHKEFFISWRYQSLVKQIFEEQKPDIVHLQDPAPLSQMVLKEARKRLIPVVCTHHTGPAVWAPYLSEKDPLMMKVAVPIIWGWIISFLNQADMVTVPSRASVRMLMEHGLKVPVKAISCGVELSRFSTVLPQEKEAIRTEYEFDPRKKQLLYVGRIDEEKRVDILLRGMARSKAKNVELILAGGGGAEEAMHRLAKRLKIQHKVRFLGKVKREMIPALYAACDAFIMPGDVESLSIATLEAMACGKPVIAANAMALPELVAVGKNGLLFKPRNAADLGQKIDQLSAMNAAWPAMGESSLERVQHHALSATIQHYANLYQRMIDRAVPKRHIPVWVRLPQTLINPYALVIFAQWAATFLVVLISLLTRNTPVVAARPETIELISPEAMQNIRELFSTLRHLDFPSSQASGMIAIAETARNMISAFRP